jgi:hypothetical protein
MAVIDRLRAYGAREEESEDIEDPGNWKRLPPSHWQKRSR